MLKTALFIAATFFTLISSEVIHLNSKNFDKVVDGTRNVLVKFEASWCGPCKAMIPILHTVSQCYGGIEGETIIAAIDADDEYEIGDRFDIRAFPTIKMFLRGKDQRDNINYEGPRTVEAFKSFINQVVAANEASLPEEIKNRPRSMIANLMQKSKKRINSAKNFDHPFHKSQNKVGKRNPDGIQHKRRVHQNQPSAPKQPKAPRQRNQATTPSVQIRDVSDEEARSIIKNSGNKAVILIVYSHNCPHCREFLPIAQQYSLTRDDVIFIKLDGQKYYQYRDSFNLQFYPSIIGFKANSAGQSWQLLRGGRSIDNINSFIRTLQ